MTEVEPAQFEKTIKTTCSYCGVGCGVLAKPSGDGSFEIRGDENHPANQGRLCSKGSALGETLSFSDRLKAPHERLADGSLAEVSWDEALTKVADQFAEVIKQDGPDAVALYVSGQFLTEDYYVANKLMKGALGTANIDTNSRLCMSSTVAGQKRAFGTDTVPNCYEDLEQADVIVLVGSNLAWCHPIIFQRIEAARQGGGGPKLVCIDPRRTTTAVASDLHLALQPGSDVALFNGLLTYLIKTGKVDEAYVAAHLEGFEECFEVAAELSLSDIARKTRLMETELTEFYELFAATPKVMTLFSQGVNQSSAGTDKVNSILNCHLITGRIGREGCGPFSLTGQPNAMGGREVGGLANQLAGHMELANELHRDQLARFWGVEAVASKPGLNAVDLFQAIDDGTVKALWIMATNPVDSLPEADFIRQALKKCPFVVVSDVSARTDTTELADVLLPSEAWGEKDGTVTNSERCISRQRAFMKPPFEAKADWWQICEVAKRLGFEEQFAFSSARDIFIEHAALSGFENEQARDFNISALQGLSPDEYEELTPVQWPCRNAEDLKAGGTKRLFAKGGFFSQSGKAKLVATSFKPAASVTCSDFPFILNTGRIRDQWHTMTRTAKTGRLMRHIGEPFVEMNEADAQLLSIADAEIVELRSAVGAQLFRVRITDAVLPGTLFAPIHWTDQFAARARVDALVSPNLDPVSGQPESKYTPVKVVSFQPRTYGLVVTKARPDIEALRAHFEGSDRIYWALMPVDGGWALECAGDDLLEADIKLLSAFFGFEITEQMTPFEVVDPANGSVRRVYFTDDRLDGVLMFSPEPLTASRVYMKSLLEKSFETPREKIAVLTGRPGEDVPESGAIICSCFNVGALEIERAVTDRGCSTVKQVGEVLNAGTNCGSCRSEIGRLIEASLKLEDALAE